MASIKKNKATFKSFISYPTPKKIKEIKLHRDVCFICTIYLKMQMYVHFNSTTIDNQFKKNSDIKCQTLNIHIICILDIGKIHFLCLETSF